MTEQLHAQESSTDTLKQTLKGRKDCIVELGQERHKVIWENCMKRNGTTVFVRGNKKSWWRSKKHDRIDDSEDGGEKNLKGRNTLHKLALKSARAGHIVYSCRRHETRRQHHDGGVPGASDSAKQKAYLGTSGWTYSEELGFNVADDDRDAWSNFTKAHMHFKPFTMRGWVHFKIVDEIVLSRALGRYVFSPGTTQLSDDATPQSQETPQEPSQLSQGSDEEEDTTNTQPYSDWSQSNFGDSQPSDVTPIVPASQSTSTPVSHHARTPSVTSRRSATDKIEPPWSSKHSRTTGPESILALGHSVDGIGKVIETVFAPPKSSAMSPTKKVDASRQMALEDLQNGYIMSDERTQLHILF
ncbi:hypothetical protein DFH07DRAFT_772663 [Mycena maculata]|uniref:Uncharacterized protein n=1 Tax=Mycena maculata TaxID=230809 RepID=A0AAD7J844_9AGAR|nr:hypothetical protein DFH07DRAFT_772663 [Mycena maculata]